jgi:hypothetical protein
LFGQAEVGPGVRFELEVPAGSREVPEGDLPAVNVAGLPGVSVALRRGFRIFRDGARGGDGGDEGSIFVGCVRGPSDKWAPGVEELVLARATSIARGSIGADLERLDARPIRVDKLVIDQRLSGEGTRLTKPAVVEVRHLLVFAGEAREGVLCSVACVEPRGPGSISRCGDVVASASFEGALMEAPPPSLLVRLILAAAERPLHAGVLLAVLGLGLVALVLARRPRPRPL